MSAPARHTENGDWLARFFGRAGRHARVEPRRDTRMRTPPAELDSTERALRSFAAGMAHELRTPLTALSGEIQLALRRQRSVGDYQQALARIAERATELIEMTGDLALFGDLSAGTRETSVVRVDALFAAVAARFNRSTGTPLVLDAAGLDARVVGDVSLLGRAMTLIVEHAWRHRHPTARMRLKCAPPASGFVPIVIEATPPGFLPQAWDYFALSGPADHATAPGQLRLRTASRIVQEANGSIEVAMTERGAAVFVRLPQG